MSKMPQPDPIDNAPTAPLFDGDESAAIPPADVPPKRSGRASRSRVLNRSADRAAARPDKAPTRAKRTAQQSSKVATTMESAYGAAGVGLLFAGRPAMGNALTEHSKAAGEAWAKLADEYPSVARVLDQMTTVSVWQPFIAVHVQIAVSMLAAKKADAGDGGSIISTLATMFGPAPAAEAA